MAFQYRAGNAANIAAWFTVFEEMIVAAGWSIVSGSGTTNMIISSLGENGDLTNLFAHVREIAGVIWSDLRDDAAGTHVTTAVSVLTSAGGPFDYWMNADADFVCAVSHDLFPQWRLMFFGHIFGVALVANEEQMMAAGAGVWTAGPICVTILQDYLLNWDVDMVVQTNQYAASFPIHPVNGSITLCAPWVNFDTQIYGQLPNVARMAASVVNGTAIATQDGNRETTWIALQDLAGNRLALRTGGVRPIGLPEGSFAYSTGRANGPAELNDTIIPAFMTGLGWTDLGNPTVHTFGHLYYSRGESGTDDIYVLITWNAGGNDFQYFFVQDDAVGTHRTTGSYTLLDISNFPLTYHLAGDRDSVLLVAGTLGQGKYLLWAGKPEPGNPGLDCTYHMANLDTYVQIYRQLRNANGLWNQLYTLENDGPSMEPSSASEIDDLTCTVWPMWGMDDIGGPWRIMIGQFTYLYSVAHNNRLTDGDQIRIEGRNYKLFSGGAGTYAIRTE